MTEYNSNLERHRNHQRLDTNLASYKNFDSRTEVLNELFTPSVSTTQN